MDDQFSSFSKQALSADDLSVLQAFDIRSSWQPPASSSTNHPSATPESSSDADLFTIFLAEATEDIGKMQHALHQLAQEEPIHPIHFTVVRQLSHKLRGTAAAVDFPMMSAIADQIEVIAEKIIEGSIFPEVGCNALSQAVSALEIDLQTIAEQASEIDDAQLINELDAYYKSLHINLQASASLTTISSGPDSSPSIVHPNSLNPTPTNSPSLEQDVVAVHIPSQFLTHESPPTAQFIRVDAHRFARLEMHAEPLVEQRASLEDAQAQVEAALRELHAAQAHLQDIEQSLSISLLKEHAAHLPKQFPSLSSSLVERILHEAQQPYATSNGHHRKSIPQLTSQSWDELNMERYTEQDMLIHALREATAATCLATTHVSTAYMHLHMLQQEYMTRVSMVRSDALLMRLAPLSVLVPRLQRVVMMSALAQERTVQFEVVGETTEIDQDILDALSMPLLQLLRACISNTLSLPGKQSQPHRIWLHAGGAGNEITIEVGFSMIIQGGAIEAIRDQIQHLHGTITLQRNETGGISFFLHFPRSHGAAQCLLIREGNQHFIVPFSQILRIGDRHLEQIDPLYSLCQLLHFPAAHTYTNRVQPVLIPTSPNTSIGICVDEVVDEIELVIKPLPSYLQRPGISGSATDGKGKVLLMLDLSELVRQYNQHAQHPSPAATTPIVGTDTGISQPAQPHILVADDSAYLRRSLIQILEYANYRLTEASDGLEALEHLQKCVPDLFLLDVEMPNLNGYDLLSLVRHSPRLAHIKVVMLTSRSSEKHMQHALDLGADAYLTKPCSQSLLLEIIQKLLKR